MIKIIGPRDPRDKTALNVTSCSKNWAQNLSPMLLGPVPIHGRNLVAQRVENAWQYSKVYSDHVDQNGDPNLRWKLWSAMGYTNPRGVRYPKGKGAKPLYAYWDGQKLDYYDARFKIYVPSYARAARNSGYFARLQQEYKNQGHITMWDFDGYDYLAMNRSLQDCANDLTRPLGHAFVLGMMLEGLV